MPLAECVALCVDESVEEERGEEEMKAVREPLGEPEGEEDTEAVEHCEEDEHPRLEPVRLPLEEEDGHLLLELEWLLLDEIDALLVKEAVGDWQGEAVKLPVSQPLAEPEREKTAEAVEHNEEDGLLVLKPERRALDETDTLLVDEAVLEKLREGVLLLVRETEDEPDGERDIEEVTHCVAVALPLPRPVRLPLEVGVPSAVAEMVEVGHCERVPLPLLKPLGDGGGVPVAEKLASPEKVPHCVEVTVAERQREGVPLPVRDSLAEPEGEKEAEEEWHSVVKELPLGLPEALMLKVSAALRLPEKEVKGDEIGVCEPAEQEEGSGEAVLLPVTQLLDVTDVLGDEKADAEGESELEPDDDPDFVCADVKEGTCELVPHDEAGADNTALGEELSHGEENKLGEGDDDNDEKKELHSEEDEVSVCPAEADGV